MTPSQLDHKSDALEALRARWEAAIVPTVGAKVADAHAHALKALTDTLKRTTDGRPSVLQINRSPSFSAALGRLDELWSWLAGPSELSLRGKVRDAREDFYRHACDLWFPLIPAELRSRSAADPTAAQVKHSRAAVVLGFDPRKFLEGPVSAAKRTLKAALERAGQRSTPGHVEDDLLAAWESRAAGALGSAARTLLNDSVEHADTQAGRDLIHPDRLAGPGDEIPTGE